MVSFMRTIVQPGADPGGDALCFFSKECAEVCNQAVRFPKSPTKEKICSCGNDLNQILITEINECLGMMVLQFIPRISICYVYIHEYKLDKPARLTVRVLWFLFLIVRRVPRLSESGCKKCIGLKKYLLGHLMF